MKTDQLKLKIKIKTLVDESREIRRQELANKRNETLVGELYLHRTGIVRTAARESMIAYGIIRGRSYLAIEAVCRKAPSWKAIANLVDKFGARADYSGKVADVMQDFADRKKAQKQRLEDAMNNVNVVAKKPRTKRHVAQEAMAA